IDHADVVVRKDDGQLFDGESLALPPGAHLPRAGHGALSALSGLDGRCDGLLHGKSLNQNGKTKKTRLYVYRSKRGCSVGTLYEQYERPGHFSDQVTGHAAA